MAENSFDYIIAGGGMAGLSLAFYLDESRLRERKILVIDRAAKTANDHTWCFWEKSESAFEEIVFRKWKGVWFHGTRGFSEILDLNDYEYKMIRAEDFYKFALDKLKANPNFTLLQADILKIEDGIVKTDKGEFAAKEFIFDSSTRKAYDNPKYQNLRQHFKGWLIETEKPIFEPDKPTLFDFRVEQKNECRFAYILPFTERQALIEFTVFSGNILPDDEYDFYLGKYIAEVLQIEKYKILETEKGVIPMSDEPHDAQPAPKIIRIGTAGGYVKPSTGYSFERTQRRLKNLVASLETNTSAIQSPKSKIQNWKSYLDSVLLNVLLTKKHAADDVFTQLFSKNKPAQVLKFLDEDTSLAEDLAIMQSVPLAPFTRAAMATLLKKTIKYLNR
ncbi:MAG: lycopene cyclase family protein [Pyrinomonadaceae bacterium]